MRTMRVISILLYFVFCKYCLANGKQKQLYRETVTFDNADAPRRAKPVDERINLTFPGL